MFSASAVANTQSNGATKRKQVMSKGGFNAKLDNTRSYMRSIGRIPRLTHEQEIELGKQVQQMMSLLVAKEDLTKKLRREPKVAEWAAHKGLKEAEINQILRQGHRAKQKMVEANLRLVVAIAKKYTKRNLEFLDLIQEGNIGLQQAVEKYDPSKGYRFSTYAYWLCRQGITRAIATSSRTIHLPTNQVEKLNKIKKTQRELSQRLGRTPTVAEIASVLELTPETVRQSLEWSRIPVSLDIAIGSEQNTTLAEIIEDTEALKNERQSLMRDEIEQLMTCLTPQEQEVLSLRFGLVDGADLSLAEIGRRLQLSRERIRQVEARSLKKLQQCSQVQKGDQ